jgi:NADPH:quinone reductase-like Zn-dependent oxidoreductase
MAKSFKAAVYEQYGGPEVIQVLSRPVPTLQKNQVLVKVHAAALNPIDWKLMKGLLSFVPGFLVPKPSKEKPIGLGLDISGEVVEVGSEVKDLKVGDEVFGKAAPSNGGTIAEYFTGTEEEISLKPKNINHAEAASLPLVMATSLEALLTYGQLKKGGRVLILGGSSGTGSVAIQIARQVGASHIATTCSGRNEALVRELGAHQVIDYTKEQFSDVLKGQMFDIVYDCVGGRESWDASIDLLGSKGKYLTIVGDNTFPSGVTFGGAVSLLFNTISRSVTHLFGRVPYYKMIAAVWRPEFKKYTKEQVEAGALKPVVGHQFAFTEEQLREAYKLSISAHARGKIVINIA